MYVCVRGLLWKFGVFWRGSWASRIRPPKMFPVPNWTCRDVLEWTFTLRDHYWLAHGSCTTDALTVRQCKTKSNGWRWPYRAPSQMRGIYHVVVGPRAFYTWSSRYMHYRIVSQSIYHAFALPPRHRKVCWFRLLPNVIEKITQQSI